MCFLILDIITEDIIECMEALKSSEDIRLKNLAEVFLEVWKIS